MSRDPAPGPEFARLYDTYGGLVYSTVVAIVGDHQRAEDAFQEVFLRVARAIARGVVPRHPVAWLLTIARREARRIRPGPRPIPLDLDPAAPSSPDTASRSEESRLIRDALRAIDPLERRLLILAYLADLDRAEICLRLKLTRSTFFRRLAEARRNFLRHLPGSISGRMEEDGRNELS